jgi:hypothetical protein
MVPISAVRATRRIPTVATLLIGTITRKLLALSFSR